MWKTTPAVAPRYWPSCPGTAPTDCLTIAVVGVTPRKPTRSVSRWPSEPSTGWPFLSVTYRSLATGVTWTVSDCPARLMPRLTVLPPAPAIAWRTCSQEETGRPANETMVSPGLSPAAAAGAAGSVGAQVRPAGADAGMTHWDTLDSWVVCSGIP